MNTETQQLQQAQAVGRREIFRKSQFTVPASSAGDVFGLEFDGMICGVWVKPGWVLECVRDTASGTLLTDAWRLHHSMSACLEDQIKRKSNGKSKWTEPTRPFKFGKNDHVQHYKGGIYEIVGLPDVFVIEKTGEPAYAYRTITFRKEDKHIVLRSQAEMEDGRFTLVKPKPLYGEEGYKYVRLEDAIGQLTRYGDALEDQALQKVLETITDINDDLAHGRTMEGIRKLIERAKSELDQVGAGR